MLQSKWVRMVIGLVNEWSAKDPFTYSAAVAYYTLFSFPALVIVLISISTLFLEGGRLESEIYNYLSGIVGASGTQKLEETIHQTELNGDDDVTLILGMGILLYASLRLFKQLQTALNHIWDCATYKHPSILALLRQRLLSFTVMLAIGFTLIASLLLTTLLTALSDWLMQYIVDSFIIFFRLLHVAVSFCTITLLFTLMLKLLPDTRVQWKSAALGGGVSAALFLIGEYALGLYFDIFAPQTSYGVAGAFILLMLWVSYSSIILFFGAQVSRSHQENRFAYHADAQDSSSGSVTEAVQTQ